MQYPSGHVLTFEVRRTRTRECGAAGAFVDNLASVSLARLEIRALLPGSGA